MSGLEVIDVHKRFGATEVLRGVSLAAPGGRVTALIGQNGAGKSTLFRIIMGLLRADRGSVSVEGRDALCVPLHHKHRLGLGYLPQELGSFPELTAAENLDVILELLPLARPERARRREEALRRTGLNELGDRRFDVLSGGEQRRVEIAKVLVQRPGVILLDEPFSGLDPRIVEDLAAIFRGLADEGVAVLVTDHNVHLTLPHADHVFLFAGGTVVCEGAASDVIADEQARKLYFGETFAWGA